jgi:hypothetical protein
MRHRLCFWRHHSRFQVYLTVNGTKHLLNPNRKNYMTTIITMGHVLNMKLTVLDQHGNPMLAPVTFDAPPGWSNTTPATETVVASADGQSAVATPVAPGTDTISVTCSIGGQSFSAALAVEVDPEPQVATSIRIDATVA